ncbi:hypothetical protein MJN85_32940, partial [Salmonella enterica subsp. enterica serovar Anatum]|nr:hypothetical protein [Salmonella enterica subsp. enterica serovar Anatum]
MGFSGRVKNPGLWELPFGTTAREILEDWLDDVPGDDIEDEDDEIIWVSKSEIKRDAEELKRLGAELV